MTTTTQHTPGPWKVVLDSDQIEGENIEVHDQFGRAAIIMGEFNDEETQANARLIAAALELLEALKILYSRAGHANECKLDVTKHQSCTCHMDQARAAIAKAEGRA